MNWALWYTGGSGDLGSCHVGAEYRRKAGYGPASEVRLRRDVADLIALF